MLLQTIHWPWHGMAPIGAAEGRAAIPHAMKGSSISPLASSIPAQLQTINWLRHGVTPIGVAEGLAPQEKLATLQARCLALYGYARGGGPVGQSYASLRLSRLACDLLEAMVRACHCAGPCD